MIPEPYPLQFQWHYRGEMANELIFIIKASRWQDVRHCADGNLTSHALKDGARLSQDRRAPGAAKVIFDSLL